MKTYQETVEWMFQQLPMYQQVGNRAYRIDLTNIKKLSFELDNPHLKFKSVHVAGTNGKGSVSHMLASVFAESNYKVGLYTSPHLKDFRERIRVNGEVIPEQQVVDFIAKLQHILKKENYSFFEMTVAMAFDYFAQQKVDIAIVEVGLGGRLDSTNLIEPELAVITNIGFDHTQFLGDTYEKIAEEKAGIIKPNTPVVVGEVLAQTAPVFERIAKEKSASLYFAQDTEFPELLAGLKGAYQKNNIRTLQMSLAVLRDKGWSLPEAAVQKGVLEVVPNTGLRGRWEVLQLSPKVICDTAHNAEGLGYTMKQVLDEPFKQLHLVLGVVSDKDLATILPLFPIQATYYFARPAVPRGLDQHILAEKAANFGLIGKAYESVESAYQAAVQAARSDDVVYIGGSTFTVAEII